MMPDLMPHQAPPKNLELPSAELISRFGYGGAAIDDISGVWQDSRVFKLTATTKAVIKRWSASAILQVVNESIVLSAIECADGSLCARQLQCSDGKKLAFDRNGTIWTAYEFVDADNGSAIPPSQLAAKAMARLHGVSAAAARAGTRIEEVLETYQRFRRRAKSSLSPQLQGFLDTFETYGVGRIDEIKFHSPIAIIHGDFVIENMIVKKQSAVLFDFEFSRKDHRIFDLCSLTWGPRQQSGAVILNDPVYFSTVVGHYRSIVEDFLPVSCAEVALLLPAALARTMLILGDIEPDQPGRVDTIASAGLALPNWFEKLDI